MTDFGILVWIFASVALVAAAIFFWRRKKIAGFAFTIVFIVILAGASEKRIVLTSALLGVTLESDRGLPQSNK
jgi:hypothetical protein